MNGSTQGAMNGAIFCRRTRKKGLAVFANRAFARGEIVLRDPCVIISRKDHNLISTTALGYYCFDDAGTCFIPLGYGNLINHSHAPNLTWSFSKSRRLITFKALDDIERGKELSHDYRWDIYPWEKTAKR